MHNECDRNTRYFVRRTSGSRQSASYSTAFPPLSHGSSSSHCPFSTVLDEESDQIFGDVWSSSLLYAPPPPLFQPHPDTPSAQILSTKTWHEQLLDQAESFSAEHTNRFGGRRSNLSDFAKGAMLADPRRGPASDTSASTTKLPSTVSGRTGGGGSKARSGGTPR